MSEKKCTGCGETKPLTAFYFERRRNQYRSKCKTCHNNGTASRRQVLKTDFANATRVVHYNAKDRAQRKGLAFDLTLDWVREKAEAGFCEVTGIPFEYGNQTKYRSNPYGPSLDRIDPSGGYTQDNVRLVVTAYNLMRNEYDDDLLFEVFNRWAANRGADGVRDAARTR